MPTTPVTPSAFVRSFIETVWNGGDLAALDRFLHPGYVDHNYEPATVDGLRQALNELNSAFPDQRSTIEALVADGDTVMARLTLRGTHTGTFRGTPGSGNTVEVTVYRSYRVAEGRIIEHWALFDTMALLRQIGAPAPSAPACAVQG